MNERYKVLLGLIVIVLVFKAVTHEQPKQIEEVEVSTDSEIHVGHRQTGKDQSAPLLIDTYEKTLPTLSPLGLATNKHPVPTADLIKGLERHVKLLNFKDKKKIFERGDFQLTHEERLKTAKLLQKWTENPELPFDELFDLYQIKGRDGRGNVKFTAYFTPVIEMGYKAGGKYLYPIYDKPKEWEGDLPTRQEIERKGVLLGKSDIVAFAKTRKDIRQMQLQGSGVVRFPDGKVRMLRYSGDNGRATKVTISDTLKVTLPDGETEDSIITKVRSERYIFFQPSDNLAAIGAGSVPLVPMHSIAIDTRYIPLGSCILSLSPVMNEKGRLQYHQLQILLAQDTGGAIKGPGRIDVYTGVGEEGEKRARYVSHYGKLWILKAREDAKL